MNTQINYSHLTEDQNLHNCFTAYIVTAFKNQAIKHSRKKLRYEKKFVSLEEMLELPKVNSALYTSFDTIEQMIDEENSLENIICNKALLACITNLSDRDRRIINLRIIHNMKHADIAKLLGLKNKTVEKAYERLIKKMRTNLTEELI